MKFDLPEQVKKALGIFESNGFEGFLAGGCVRDYLLGKTPADIDIATNALPQDVIRIFKECRVIETGLAHGTVTVIIDSMSMEITTYRIDGTYSDNRRPDNVEFTASLAEDLARRDFTMNAMAYSDALGTVDYCGGERDIANKIIRCVGDPNRRFKEDGLRILRGLRFASTLGFSIEEHTGNAMYGNRGLLENISRERTAAEIVKLLCGKAAEQILLGYGDILGVALPELQDILIHGTHGVSRVDGKPHLRMAMLLRGAGENRAEEILRRLRFDNFTVRRVCLLIKYCDMQIPLDRVEVKKWMRRLPGEIFKELLQIKRGCIAADTLTYGEGLADMDKLEALADEITQGKLCIDIKDLAISGRELMGLGVPRGRQIGAMLEYLLELVIDEKIENNFEALMDAAEAFNFHG